jgi:hypothetical protein
VVHGAAEVKLEALANENHNGLHSCHGSSSSLPGSKERILKFELQMYKMRDGEYCFDIQVRVRNGGHMKGIIPD